jgi:MFS family permease
MLQIVLGGAVGQAATWRWIFWVNIPICVIGLPLLTFAMSRAHFPPPQHGKWHELDWAGIFVVTASSTLFLVGLTLGGTLKPWSSAAVLCPLCFGTIGACVFVVLERRANSPVIPMRIFNDRTASAAYIGTLFHAFSLSPFCYLMPLYVSGSHTN